MTPLLKLERKIVSGWKRGKARQKEHGPLAPVKNSQFLVNLQTNCKDLRVISVEFLQQICLELELC